ncbi:MAG: PTS fructose transporter subunit IIA [Pseudomonadota bacterium]
MIGIVIVAHGGLAKEYKRAMQHVIGPVEACVTVSIDAECDRAKKEREICEAARKVDSGSGVVIVTDVFGGSPSNLSLPACRGAGRMILYGANLPALIKLAKLQSSTLEEAVATARDTGRKYIDAKKIEAS